ncbi:FAF1 [Candida pseudojiufengensis]|uniref:FAF1 n=1 Tax=Candida pseudojiufengensis TaxID=497109 RepID=UPI0022253AA8|nr:FAF1 [Candida pseudojiufengensis]KAI5965950.1 FAF1 [Candida pseudojiufengensis]
MSNEDDEYKRSLEIQRRNFEAQFGSLEDMGYEDKTNQNEEEEFTGFDSENSGESDEMELNNISEESDFTSDSEIGEYEEYEEEFNEPIPKPKVVKLNLSTSEQTPIITSKKDKKLLKSGRAATVTEIETANQKASKQTAKQLQKSQKEDSENLENDLKLQRLLKESHILANNNQFSGVDLTLKTIDYDDPTGKGRKRILNSRINELSSTNRTKEKKLESMPMKMRQGMIAKRDSRIAKYEKEARDAGIVLSKLKKGEVRDLNIGKGTTSSMDRLGNGLKKKDKVNKRDRGLKINGVGKSTRNGLIISQSDIDRINNKGKPKFKKRK